MNAIDIRIEKERDSESARVHTKLGTVYNHGRNKGLYSEFPTSKKPLNSYKYCH